MTSELRPLKPAQRYVIYCWTHVPSGRKYVGQSYRERVRSALHMQGRTSRYLRHAVQKYGPMEFEYAVLEVLPMIGDVPTMEDHEVANAAESLWIAQFNCLVPFGFNIAAGSQSAPVHELTRRKLSETRRAYWGALSPEERSEINKKRHVTMGRVATGEAMRKRARTLGSERLSEIARKREAGISLECRREIGLKKEAVMSEERRRERSQKMRDAKAAIGHERLSEIARKRQASYSPERLAEIGRKISESKKRARARRGVET
jgi:group I intron endonuclease